MGVKKITQIIMIFIIASALIAPILAQDLTSMEIGLASGLFNFDNDDVKYDNGFHSEVLLRKYLSNRVSLGLAAGMAKQTFSPGLKDIETDFVYASLRAQYDLFPFSRVTPFVYGGLGALNFSANESPHYWDADAMLGGGLSFKLNHFLRLNMDGAYHMTTGDDFDAVNNDKKDKYITAKAGLSFSLSRAEKGNSHSEDYAFMQQTEQTAQESPSYTPTVPKTENNEGQHLKALEQRVDKLSNEMNVFDVMKSELEKAITFSDQVIQELEVQLEQKRKVN